MTGSIASIDEQGIWLEIETVLANKRISQDQLWFPNFRRKSFIFAFFLGGGSGISDAKFNFQSIKYIFSKKELLEFWVSLWVPAWHKFSGKKNKRLAILHMETKGNAVCYFQVSGYPFAQSFHWLKSRVGTLKTRVF